MHMIRDEIHKYIRAVLAEECEYALDFQDDNTKGHYATNCAFSAAKNTKKSPMEMAEVIAKKIMEDGEGFFLDVKAVRPGFVNMWIRPEVFIKEAVSAITDASEFGKNNLGKGKKVRVEYVSANPTGPMHIGNARGGPYGESLSRALEMSGYEVFREYLHNDIGGQIEKLGLTVWYWYEKLRGNETEFPEGGYQGTYIEEVARSAKESLGENLTQDSIPALTAFALDFVFRENNEILKKLGIRFDLIQKESELIKSGETQNAINELRAKRFLKESEGALWFAPNDEFLDDRESVVVRSNGKPTYFASDIAYHKKKFESGYDYVIDIFGSNHHGHVPKLQALTNIFGFDPKRFLVLLYQFVRVKKGKEVMKMSKRAGTYVTAKEVLEEVGADNMIFSLLSSAPSTHLDFDLDLAKEQSMKNPVYYVQYAYVRAENIIEKTGMKEIKNPEQVFSGSTLSPHDIELIRRIVQFSEVVRDIAGDYEVHRVTRYAFEFARTFHNFYEHERVVGEAEEVFQTRLAIVFAARNAFQNLFRLIGISAPKKM